MEANAVRRRSRNSSTPAPSAKEASRVAAFGGDAGLVWPPSPCGGWLLESGGVVLQLMLHSSDCGAAGLADRPWVLLVAVEGLQELLDDALAPVHATIKADRGWDLPGL
jgi:hypothetical protein